MIIRVMYYIYIIFLTTYPLLKPCYFVYLSNILMIFLKIGLFLEVSPCMSECFLFIVSDSGSDHQCYSRERLEQLSPRPSDPEENLQDINTQHEIKPRQTADESEPEETVLDTQEVMSQAARYDSTGRTAPGHIHKK